jgi:hypothetical protein
MSVFNNFVKHTTFLTFFLCFVIQTSAFTGKYPIQNFTPKQYKAGIQNIDFAQNADMTIFVANNLGVLSFNGTNWENHVSKSGKKKRSLAFDKNAKRLYVGSQGEFGYFHDDWTYTSLIEKIPTTLQDFDEVWDVYLHNSMVYFCTFQIIYVYDGESIFVIEHEDGFDRTFFVGDRLFTQSALGKLFEIKGQALLPAYAQKQYNGIIAGIIPEEDGYLLFYNSGKIELTSRFGWEVKYEELSKAIKGKYVNHVLQLSDTRLVISTQTSGLFLFDFQTGAFQNITAHDGLLSNACLRTFQDYSGKLWVGMQNGIALIDINSPVRFINKEVNIQGSGYEAFEVEAGTYYTTSNGIYYLSKKAGKSIFLKGTEGPAYGMQKIAGKLYAGHHTGLFLLENGKATQKAVTDGLWQIKQLRSHPEYAIGGTYSGLHLFKITEKRGLKSVGKIKGFDESSRFFEEDLQGRIWVGQFYKGLYRLNLKEGLTEAVVKKVSDDYDLPLDEQIIICNIDREIYLATFEGMFKIDINTDQIVRADLFTKDIGEQPVYLVRQDKKKNIHIVTENMVGYFKQISNDNYVFVPSSLYQLRYSFNNDLLNVSVHTENGVLFNANEGFIHYNPEKESRIALEQPLLMRSVYSVTQDSVLYAREPFGFKPQDMPPIVVSHKAKVLKFTVESFQFNEINNQEFRYFLKGLDKDFEPWVNTSFKEYSNLREGDYEFLFQTRNHLGEIMTSKPYFVTVSPPFHRSNLVKVIFVILGLLTLFLISRFQKQRYKYKAEEIEKTKEQELTAKQQKLIEIEKQKDRELRTLREEKMQSELRHLNNLLAASTMNLVVKNEFMETIKLELKQIRQKWENGEIKKDVDKVVREIDSALKLQEDWEQFEYHFDKVHGDFLSRLRDEFSELSPNEQKLCAFLRLNLNTKEVANLMNISARGVEVARYRLRKKLGLKKGENLSKFVLEY